MISKIYNKIDSQKDKYASRSGRITYNDNLMAGIHFTFNYQYDKVGRLTRAECLREQNQIDYTEEFDYDKNTNIIGLRRYGAKNYNSGALLDDLTLDYEGNQLRHVTDDAPDYPYEASLDFRAKAPLDATPGASVASPFGLLGALNPIDTIPAVKPTLPSTYSADYAYDANGNMTQDRHSSITSIKYNVLNLPQSVTYEGTVLNRPVSQIVYDASGRKHIVRNGKTVVGKLPAATTTFVGDETRYIGSYIMVNDTIDRLQTPYGYLKDGEFYSYVFDYQGNVMAVVNGNDVAQTNLYYADGLPMNTSTDPTANAFKYTAKELSLFRGLPVYDYTARHTLPAIGNTFRTMDPYAEDYIPYSPYAFCLGDPVNCTDPTGKAVLFINGFDVGDGGSAEYWEGINNLIMDFLNDHNDYYFDGSPDDTDYINCIFNLNGEFRENEGRNSAKQNGLDILNNLSEGETIKVFTHSMGARYAKGFVDELLNIALEQGIIDSKESQNIIEFEIDLAPFHPENQSAVKGVPTTSISHYHDFLAGCAKMNNATNLIFYHAPYKFTHGISSFTIKEISKGIQMHKPIIGVE